MKSLLRPETVASRAGISTRTLRRRMRDSNGPRATFVGRFAMFTEEDAAAWLDSCRQAG